MGAHPLCVFDVVGVLFDGQTDVRAFLVNFFFVQLSLTVNDNALIMLICTKTFIFTYKDKNKTKNILFFQDDLQALV